MMIKKKRLGWLLVLVVMVATGCHRLDMGQLDTEPYYHGQYEGKEVVLRFDSVAGDTLYGCWYASANQRIVTSQPFNARLLRGRRIEIQAPPVFRVMTATVEEDLSSFVLRFTRNGHSAAVRFEPLEQPEFLAFTGEYVKPIYQVTSNTVVYGEAEGYWTEYPEPAMGDKDFLNYVRIVAPKVPRLMWGEGPQQLEMDVYQPVTHDLARRPLLMLIHGGAFFNGSRQTPSFVQWSNHFASLGYVVASIDYRLGFRPSKEGVDRAGFKAVQDAHAAMRYLVHHADRYKIDTTHLFVGGSSAGGITALNLAFMRDWNRPTSVVNGNNADLGLIDAVSPEYDDPFSIKAVVNMWGAVHDTTMLGNSPQTAILSFHGDADGVVAYGHDYPFLNPPTPLRDVLALFMTPPKMKSINELLFDKMYGSFCIHQRAQLRGMQSELHTYPNGPHSLHVNSDGTLSDYFYVIQDTVTAFLYHQLVGDPAELIALTDDGPLWFGLTNVSSLESWSWKVEGGVILKTETDKVQAVFFADAPRHLIFVSGQYNNGIGLMETYQVEEHQLIRQ